MECPTCRELLRIESLNDVTVDRCDRCDGLWLDDTELGAIISQVISASCPVESVDCRDDLACPKCDAALTPSNYAYDSGVFINTCASCAGVWLESGQLEQLAKYRKGTPSLHRLGNAVIEDMRGPRSLQVARRLLRSRLLSVAVVVVYLLTDLAIHANLGSAASVIIRMLLPLACIWYPDSLGKLKGVSLGFGRPKITHSTPGDFVAIGGWALLVSPIIWPLLSSTVVP